MGNSLGLSKSKLNSFRQNVPLYRDFCLFTIATNGRAAGRPKLGPSVGLRERRPAGRERLWNQKSGQRRHVNSIGSTGGKGLGRSFTGSRGSRLTKTRAFHRRAL
jgi:hypothetical protein